MAGEEPTMLIIDTGTFGTSTAYYLSKQYRDPSRITIIDRWDASASLQLTQAAAVDTNRFIRTEYESPLYCNLANEAIHPWFWNIAVQGHFHKTGWIVLDKNGEFSDAIRKTFNKRGGDYTRDIEADDLERYEVLSELARKKYGKGHFNPEAGWCDAEKATASFTKFATNNGVQRVTGNVQDVLFDACHSQVEGVRLDDGRLFKADKIVLATGAWTSSLLTPIEERLELQEKDRIERQITAVGRLSAYYTLSKEEAQSIIDSKMPVVVIG